MASRVRTRPRRPAARSKDERRRSGGLWALGIVAAILLLTTDDRHVGSVADGRQMIWTAVAIAETGEITQASGRDFTFPHPEGQGVSRYGMGMSFAQLPAAWLAPIVEARLGAGSSQPLFLIAPLLFTLLAAWAAGEIAGELGGGTNAKVAAILLASVASPLGSYAAMEFSEPMQAAALAMTLWMSMRGRGTAAGLAAGVALLVKSANLVVAPLAMLPLWRKRRFIGAAVSYSIVAVVWLVFEIRRFGAPLANYPGEGFTNPIWDGTWRLLFSLPEGLVLFYPAAVVAVIARTDRLTRAAALLPSAALLGLAAAYWGWHGNEGWGPRLVLPCIPLLAPLAAVQIERWGRAATIALVSLCFVVNLPPLIQHPTPVATYITNLEWPQVPAEDLHGIPPYARDGDRLSPDLVLAKVNQATPFIVFPWFARATWADAETSARMLESPPWLDVRPDLRPRHSITPSLARYLTHEPRWNFFGRGFSPSPLDVEYRAVYDEGLHDQIVKMHQQRRPTEALELAEKLHRLAPDGESVALILESYRLLGWSDEAKRFLVSQPVSRRLSPKINVVLALFERDAGNETGARVFLANAAPAFPDAPIQRAVSTPLENWPEDLQTMIARPVGQVGGQ